MSVSPDDSLDSVSRRRDITPDLALEYAYNCPAKSFKLLADLLIACDVPADLRYPEIGVAVISELLLHAGKAALLPAIPVPHVTIYEDSHLDSRKHEIRFARQLGP
jgi:hypothetical protein